jgi:hypothetical protein
LNKVPAYFTPSAIKPYAPNSRTRMPSVPCSRHACMHGRRVCVLCVSRHNHCQIAFWHEHRLPRARSTIPRLRSGPTRQYVRPAIIIAVNKCGFGYFYISLTAIADVSPSPCFWLCVLNNSFNNMPNSLVIFCQSTNHKPEPLCLRKTSRTPHASNQQVGPPRLVQPHV